MASGLVEVAGACTPCRVGLVPVDLDRVKIGSGKQRVEGIPPVGQPGHPGGRHVPARQPLLAHPGIETAISLTLALAGHCLWRFNRRMPDGQREGWPADSLSHLQAGPVGPVEQPDHFWQAGHGGTIRGKSAGRGGNATPFGQIMPGAGLGPARLGRQAAQPGQIERIRRLGYLGRVGLEPTTGGEKIRPSAPYALPARIPPSRAADGPYCTVRADGSVHNRSTHSIVITGCQLQNVTVDRAARCYGPCRSGSG
jgi:hypothetical protein